MVYRNEIIGVSNMTKFSISASRSQAQAAAKACSNLKSDVNQLMNKC